MIYVTRKERTLYFVKYCDFLKLLLQVSIRSFNYHQSSNSNEDRSSVKLTHVHTMHMSMRTALKDWDAYHATWEGNLFLSSRPSSRTRLGSGLTKTFRLHSENNRMPVLTDLSAQDVRFQYKFRTWTGFPKLQINCTRPNRWQCTAFPRIWLHWAIKWFVKAVKKSLRVFTLVLVLLILLNIERICDARRTRLTWRAR